jgi:hypothetical protein
MEKLRLATKALSAEKYSDEDYGDSDMSEMPMAKVVREKFQINLDKLMELKDESSGYSNKQLVMELLGMYFSGSMTSEKSEIIKNTLISNNYLITKREDSLNKVMGN